MPHLSYLLSPWARRRFVSGQSSRQFHFIARRRYHADEAISPANFQITRRRLPRLLRRLAMTVFYRYGNALCLCGHYALTARPEGSAIHSFLYVSVVNHLLFAFPHCPSLIAHCSLLCSHMHGDHPPAKLDEPGIGETDRGEDVANLLRVGQGGKGHRKPAVGISGAG
jgi:hypothetical protein